jgi:DoxX-like family
MPKLILTYLIAFVWLANGLFCKVLNLVPRHQEIVARILGDVHAPLLTKLIGFSEILMCLWIVSRIKSRWCAITQIIIVATMNTIEFVFAKDLLLFGSLNAFFAFLFCCVVFATEFVLARKEE